MVFTLGVFYLVGVDTSKQQIGTGGPFIVPTPYPITRPSILPPQEVPSLPTKSPLTPRVTVPGVHSQGPGVSQRTPQQLNPQSPRVTVKGQTGNPPSVTRTVNKSTRTGIEGATGSTDKF